VSASFQVRLGLAALCVALCPVSVATAQEPVRFTVSASGDILMHKPLLDRALAYGDGRRYDFAPFFRELHPYVEDVDLGLCHAETPLGPGKPSTYPRFKTPPALARSIRQSGWDACSTASNHSLDQGQSGIDSTVRAFEKQRLDHTGTFASRKASKRPTIIRVNGVRVGFVSYTDATNGLSAPHSWSVNEYRAADPRAGARKIMRDVKRTDRAGADAIIVNVHWGAEYAKSPNGSQQRVARRLAGSRRVTAIVGQGPHVVQPIRRLRDKFVVFSEGNLVSNQRPATGQPAASQDGLIAMLDMEATGARVKVRRVRYVPIWVRPGDFTVLPAKPGAGRDELRASYRRTVSVAGRTKRIKPVFGG
jgi:poly-gamma-glutamate synthesis protein (capsule biosynthesis protein)